MSGILHDEVTAKKPDPNSQSECSDIIKYQPAHLLIQANPITTDQSLTIFLIICCTLATNYMYCIFLIFLFIKGVIYYLNKGFHGVCGICLLYVPRSLCTLQVECTVESVSPSAVCTMVSVYPTNCTLNTYGACISISCSFYCVCVLYQLYVPWFLCTLSTLITMVSVYSASHCGFIYYQLSVQHCLCTL
jgi:hypothetical protein